MTPPTKTHQFNIREVINTIYSGRIHRAEIRGHVWCGETSNVLVRCPCDKCRWHIIIYDWFRSTIAAANITSNRRFRCNYVEYVRWTGSSDAFDECIRGDYGDRFWRSYCCTGGPELVWFIRKLNRWRFRNSFWGHY
jgi:hypothetical protein